MEVNAIGAISIVNSDCWVSITRRGSFVVGEDSIGKDSNGSVSVGSPDDDCCSRRRELLFPERSCGILEGCVVDVSLRVDSSDGIVKEGNLSKPT